MEPQTATEDEILNKEAGTRPRSINSPRYVWYVIFLLALVYAFNHMDRMALAILAPLIKTDLKLSDAQLGLTIGFAFSLVFAICGIPIARLADRSVRRNIIALSLATWSVMTALSGAAQNVWQLFLGRVGVGAGEAGLLPPSHSILCDYVPLKRRSGVFAVHESGIYAGMVLGMGLAGWLGEVIGWRLTFVALGLPGIALALIVRLTLREPARGSFDAAQNGNVNLSLSATIRVLWHCRSYRLVLLFCVANGFVLNGLHQWLPSMYVRVYGLSLSSVGFYLGLAIAVGSGIGLLMGGLLGNKAAQRDVKLPLLVSAGAVSLALPCAIASLFVTTSSDSMLFVALSTMFCAVSNGPVTATLYSVTASPMRATGGAIAIFAVSVVGISLGPFSVGLVSDLLVSSLGSESLRYALLAPVSLLPAMAILLYACAKNLPADLMAAGAHTEDNAGGHHHNTSEDHYSPCRDPEVRRI